jgi:hypothetical protein
MVGEDETWSGEALVSGIYNQASFSVGYERFNTEGFRVNADQSDEIANAFFQVALGYKTSVQAEVRYRDVETGDRELRFFADDFRPELREQSKGTTARVGLRHSLSPGSILLFSYVHQEQDLRFRDGLDIVAGTLSTALDQDGKSNSFETQYLYRSPAWGGLIRGVNVAAGAGYFDLTSDEVLTVEIDLPPPPFGPGPIIETVPLDAKVEHTNLYGYSNISFPGEVTVTLGVSADVFEEEGGVGKKDQTNPKAGVTWNPLPRTTLRAAVFRTLKRTLITDQTIEPTQVAGFNQFFDDATATSAWLYGGAIDQKITDSLFTGFEYSKRTLEVPTVFVDFETFETLFLDLGQDEHVSRVYFFAAPHQWLGFNAEYQYEKLEHDPMLQLGFETVKTHRVPFGVRFFHPTGFGASLRATYLKQNGRFELREPPFGFVPGEVDFWVIDAGFRYRLPKRYGFVSVGVNNLTDEDSRYLATESVLPSAIRNLLIRPGRVVFAKITLAWP